MPSPYGFPSLRYWPLSKQATSEWKGNWWPEQSRWTLQRCLTSSMGHGAAYFHRGTTPWPSYRLPDPCGLDFPPQPLAIPASPAPCPSSVLRGGSSVLPDPGPGGDHRLCQGPVMVHPQVGHSPWTHLNFSNLLSSESTSLPTTSSPTSLRPHVGGKSPTPEPPLPVSAQLLGTSCACCLSSYLRIQFLSPLWITAPALLKPAEAFPNLTQKHLPPSLPTAAAALAFSVLPFTAVETVTCPCVPAPSVSPLPLSSGPL